MPSYVPVWILASILRHFEHFLLPLDLDVWNLVLGQQSLPFSLVVPLSLQIGTHFSRKWSLNIHFVGRIEESRELVKVRLCNRIMLVIMAAGTAHGHSQPNCAQGRGSINDLFNPVFLDINALLSVGESIAK